MKRKLLALTITFSWGAQGISAASFAYQKDSLNRNDSNIIVNESLEKTNTTNFTDSKLYQMTFVGVPLVVTGLIMRGEDSHFRSLRNDYMKEFHRPFDNYTQYVPGVVMFGMKALGVKGRSSWSRMITSDAISAAIMGSVVQTMKHTTNITRPDGSDNHSFPSGHTAMAFMNATMLTKEYGHISPWIGVGAYTFATGTGLMRIANNKHWLSDVLTGAGIGILSTELGYYIGDLIFKQRGINHFTNNETFSKKDKPSFFGLYLGVNIPLSHYDISEGITFRTSSGSSAGIEGTYFFTPYIGIGGRFAASNTHIITTSSKEGSEQKESVTTAEDKFFDAISGMVGPYVSYPITPRWLIGSKLLSGYITYPKLTLSDGTVVPKNDGICFGSGISITYKAKERYGIRFFLDYNLQPSHSKCSDEWINTLSIGSSFGINF